MATLRRATVERAVSELVDIGGIAQHLGLTLTTVRTDVIRRPDFPTPIAQFGQSKVWWLGDIDQWNTTKRRPVGRPTQS